MSLLTKLLSDSWSFFRNHVVALSAIILPIVIPLEIITDLYGYFYIGEDFVLTEQLFPMVLGIVVYPLYKVGVIFYIASTISGEHLGIKNLWIVGIKFWVPYFVLSILVSVAVILGLILLVLPGLYVAVRYSFCEFDLLLKQSTPLDAMRNSWVATKEHAWLLLGGLLAITLALYIPYYLFFSILEKSNISYLIINSLTEIAYSVLGVLYTIFMFRVYVFAKSTNEQ